MGDAVSQACKLSHSEIYEYQKGEFMFYVQEVTKMVTTWTTGYQGMFYLWEIFQWMRLYS